MKRVPGILALLIISVTLIVPFIRQINYELNQLSILPFAQPVAWPIPQAVWLASILGATLCFLVAAISPKTWSVGLGCVMIGLIVLGAGWYYQKADQLESSSHLNDTNWDKDPDVPQMRAVLEKLIPLQIPLIDAKARMESVKFVCTVVDEIHHPPHVTQTFSTKPAIHLYCEKEDRWPKHKIVIRRWQVDVSFPPGQSPNPGVAAVNVSCAHYFWRVFLFWTFANSWQR